MSQPTERLEPGEGRDPGRLVGSDRVLAVLREVGGRPEGATLEELAHAVASPKPTVHRALVALRRAGFAQQDGHGRYCLGDEYLRLAFSYHQARPDHLRVRPVLEELAKRFGETAHYGVLDGRDIVYRAKADPVSGAVHLTSTVGGRNPAHSTAIGLVLLAHRLPDLGAVRGWVGQGPLERRTARTLTTAAELHACLVQIRHSGFAVDEEANEPGVACVALPVSLQPDPWPTGAISVTALTFRTPLADMVGRLPEIAEIVGPLAYRGAR